MSHYSHVIRDAIIDDGFPHHTDAATLALVEDCLRTNRTSLDHLSRADLAVETYATLSDLVSHPDQTRTLCELLGLELPYWVDQPPPPRPLSTERTRHAIITTLQHAFPGTRFQITPGRGSAHTQLVLAWCGGPAKSSVEDVVAQFLPDPDTLSVNSRYSCTAIYSCRRPALPQVG